MKPRFFKECPNCDTRYFNVRKRKCHAKGCGSCKTPYILSEKKLETGEDVLKHIAQLARMESFLEGLRA